MKQILYLIILYIFLAGCKGTQKKNDHEGGKPMVSVTIEPFRYFVNQIAGDKVDVNVMVPAGSNPETYEPTPQQMVKLSESALYLKVGKIGFEETWMKKLTDNAPDMKVEDTSVGITPVKTAGGIADPHTWMSIRSARTIAKNICKSLCALLPTDSTLFKSNCSKWTARLDTLEQQLQQVMDNSGKGHVESFVIYHPALTYFAHDYSLNQLPIEEEGREPSIAQIKALVEKAKRENITTVFIQKEFANRNTQTFLNATHARAIEINPLSYEWEKEMIFIAKNLTKK